MSAAFGGLRPRKAHLLDAGGLASEVKLLRRQVDEAFGVIEQEIGGRVGYNYTQSVPSDTWIINHNLGYYPDVQARDSGGNRILAQIQHTSVNQVRIYFTVPLTGSARLS